MAAPKKAAATSGKKPARGGQKAVVKAPVKNTAATSRKPVVGAKKPSAAMPKSLPPASPMKAKGKSGTPAVRGRQGGAR
jgi:hypothetical protein